MLGDPIIESRAPVGIVLQRETAAERLDAEAPILAGHEGIGERIESGNLLIHVGGAEIGIDGSSRRFLNGGVVVLVVGRHQDRLIGIAPPQVVAVGIEANGLAKVFSGLDVIARVDCLVAIGEQLVELALGRLVGDGALQLASLVDEALANEAQFLSAGFRNGWVGCFGGDNPTSHRAGKGPEIADRGLLEAPLGLGVVGEGDATIVANAGRLAVAEFDALQRVDVLAEIIGAIGDHRPPLGRFARLSKGKSHRRKTDEREKSRQTPNGHHEYPPRKPAAHRTMTSIKGNWMK